MSFRSARHDLGLVIGAKAVSYLGDLAATIGLVLRLQSEGAGTSAVAALLVANLAPIVLLSGVVGRLVDRYRHRTLLIVSSSCQAAICLALAFASGSPAVLTLVAMLGAGQALTAATWQALVPALVEPARLPRVLGLTQAMVTLAGIVAPALAGLLTGLYGARVPLLIDTGTFLAVLTAALLLTSARGVSGGAGTGERMRGGLAIVWNQPLLRAALLLLGLFILLGGTVNVVEVFLVREVLHASPLWYGLNDAAFAGGLLAGSLLAGRLRVGTHAHGLIGGAAGLSLGLVAMGLAPSVGVLMLFGFATGVMNGVLSVCTATVVMGTAAPEERGRIGALQGGLVSGCQLVAYALGAVLSGALGPRGVFVLGGTLGLLAPVLLGRTVLRASDAHPRDLSAGVVVKLTKFTTSPADKSPIRAGDSGGRTGVQADFSRRSRFGVSRGTRVG